MNKWKIILAVVFAYFCGAFGGRYHGYAPDTVDVPAVRSIAERRAQIAKLKRIRREELAPLVQFFDSLKAQNLVRWYALLWIVRGIVWEGTPKSLELARQKFPQFRFRPDAHDTAVIADRTSGAYHLARTTTDSPVWNVEMLGIQKIRRKFGAYGDGILVGIFDTGISRWVPDLRGKIFTNPGEGNLWNSADDDHNLFPDDIWGYNFFDSTSHPYDDRGHGTHVSGTVAGELGTGVAPGCKIIALKVLDYFGRGEESAVWLAVEYALDMGVRVGNFSIGWRHSADPDRPMWREVMSNAMALGMVCVVGSGNEGSGSEPDNIRTPGDVPEVITVGAADSTLALASFSSTGPVEWDDYPYPPGLIKPDIVAPGDGVVSCVIPGGYESWGGTSMATPHISAACAIISQINPSLTPAEIKAIMESTAVDLGDPGKDNQFGSGFINLEAAILSCAEMCTLQYSAAVGGTLVAMPHRLKFFGDGDTIIIPQDVEYLVFFAEGFAPETIYDFRCGEEIEITPEPGTHTCRIGVMDFDTGEPLSAQVYAGDDTFAVDGFSEIEVSVLPVEVCATLPGYTAECDTIAPEDGCKFLFLHRCEDFEDSAAFSGDGDWEWGIPTFGPGYARSGQKVWATSLADTYSSSSDSWLWSRWYWADTTGAVYIWQWYDCEATDWGFWDGGNVVADFGDSTKILFPIGDYACWIDDYNEAMPWEPAFSGTLTGNFWHQKVFPLMIDEPCSLRVGFHFGSDDNTTRSGWYIDDVCVVSRRVREPIIGWVSAESGSVWVCAYAVSGEMAQVRAISCDDAAEIALEQTACDTFSGELWGSPGDTVHLKIVAENSVGLADTFPADSCITAVIPWTGIVAKPRKSQRIYLSVRETPCGFFLYTDTYEIYIFNIKGDLAFHRVLNGESGEIFWRPERTGAYVVLAKRGARSTKTKIIWIK